MPPRVNPHLARFACAPPATSELLKHFFARRWFDLVLVLQTDNTVLYERLEARCARFRSSCYAVFCIYVYGMGGHMVFIIWHDAVMGSAVTASWITRGVTGSWGFFCPAQSAAP